MSFDIVVKDVSPVLTVTHIKASTVQTMAQTIYGIHDEVKKNIKGSFICYVDQTHLYQDLPVRIHCPVQNAYESINEKKYTYVVLQRSKVVSTINQGEFHDLDNAFLALQTYVEENKLEVVMPYRVIFHKEKRKWQRKRLFKKSSRAYITEVQIQIKNPEPVSE